MPTASVLKKVVNKTRIILKIKRKGGRFTMKYLSLLESTGQMLTYKENFKI